MSVNYVEVDWSTISAQIYMLLWTCYGEGMLIDVPHGLAVVAETKKVFGSHFGFGVSTAVWHSDFIVRLLYFLTF